MTDIRGFAILAVAYWLAAVVGLQGAAVGGAGSPVWPAGGVALAGLLLGGVRLWPAIALGSLAAAWATGSNHAVATELAIAGGNALAAALPALVLRRSTRFDRRLARLDDIIRLALAAAGGAAIGAGIGTGAVWLATGLEPAPLLFATWWFGTAVGSLVVGALVLAWADRDGNPATPLGWLHLGAILVATGGLSAAVFLDRAAPLLLPWHIFPVLIWGALAFQVRGAALALLTTTGFATWGAAEGAGPFALVSDTAIGRLFYAQQFAALTGLVILALATVAGERRGKAALTMSERRLRDALESTGDSVFVLDRDWRFTFLNRRAIAQIAGGRDLLGLCIWDAFPQAVGTDFERAYRGAMSSGRPTRADQYYAPLEAWYEADAYPTDDGLTVFFRDVTETRRAATLVAEGDARLRAIFTAIDEGFSLCEMVPDADGRPVDYRFLEVNPRFEQITGLSGVVGRTATEVLPGLEPFWVETYARVALGGETLRFQSESRTTGRWYDVFATPVAPSGRFVALFSDITERRRAETELRRSEALLNAILDALPVGVVIADAQGRVVRDNAANREIWGIPPETVSWEEYDRWEGYRPETGERIRSDQWGMARSLLHGEVVKGELVECVRFDTGERRLFLNNSAPVRDADGRIVAGVVAELDVTARMAVERALLESEARFRNMADNAPVMVWVTEADGRCTFMSRSWYTFTGQTPEAGLGFGWLEMVHPDDRDAAEATFRAATAERAPFRLEYRLCRADGRYVWAIDAAAPRIGVDGAFLGFIGSVLDISERKAAEEALTRLNAELEQRVAENTARMVQLQKTESLGRLTGGLAHDFNNLLMAILSSLELAAKRLPPGDPARVAPLIENALLGVRRGAALTERLLAFARKQELKPEAVDVATLIAGMTELLRRSLGPQVRIETRVAPDVPRALVDPNQLEMAILNLAVNARDAMPDGGTLTVALDTDTVPASADARDLASADAPVPAAFVRLRLTDTGVGMDAETLGRAGEPFFTTKGIGKGTGLGLAMVHGLAGQSGGFFTLTSVPGCGTTAEMLLPVAPAADGAATPPGPDPKAAAPPTPPETAARNRTRALSVLLVDDDALIRLGTAAVLEDLGHRPVEAGSGPEALAILRSGRPVDVVLTDQAMPGMTGLELAAKAREANPGLPVILASGYAEIPTDGIAADVVRLRKPYRLEQLAALLDRLAAE